jgi:hypothetical protein
LAILLVLVATPAAADELLDASRASPALREGEALPLGLAPPPREGHGLAVVQGGWDGARDSAVLEARAAVRLWGPVSLHGGAVYVARADTLRPSLGAMLDVLRQRRHGLDLAAAVTYRPEGLTEPEGEIELALLARRRIGETLLMLAGTAGQDPEGNERDVELRATALADLTPRLAVGLDGRGRFALARPDGSMEPDADLLAGGLAVLTFERWAASGFVGASVVDASGGTRATGVAAMAGLGRAL